MGRMRSLKCSLGELSTDNHAWVFGLEPPLRFTAAGGAPRGSCERPDRRRGRRNKRGPSGGACERSERWRGRRAKMGSQRRSLRTVGAPARSSEAHVRLVGNTEASTSSKDGDVRIDHGPGGDKSGEDNEDGDRRDVMWFITHLFFVSIA